MARRTAGWVAASLVILAAAWVGFDYSRDIADARARIASGSEVAQTACGPIEFAQKGSGPAVLVVHGAGGGFDQGMDFGGHLEDVGFRVIAMSRFGYLRTPLPADASDAAQADAHACLLDALGIERAAIIGASAGAPSALQFAVRHPRLCRALGLLVPAAYVPKPGNAQPLDPPASTQWVFDTALRSDFLFWAAIRVARDTLTTAVLATRPEVVEEASPQEQARVDAMLRHILPVSQRRLGLLNDAAVTSTLRRAPLERVEAPTLVLGLDDDLFGTMPGARYTAEQIRGARLVTFPRGGHVWVGRDTEVRRALRELVASAR
jgi:2-hydroxy-6-oxonona-2,4-dienedioate hydrolase